MADLSQVKPEQIREFAVGSFPADIGIEPLEIFHFELNGPIRGGALRRLAAVSSDP